ncbi:hypothetical protein GCM10018966_096010 [Streptomyces yanii]
MTYTAGGTTGNRLGLAAAVAGGGVRFGVAGPANPLSAMRRSQTTKSAAHGTRGHDHRLRSRLAQGAAMNRRTSGTGAEAPSRAGRLTTLLRHLEAQRRFLIWSRAG